MAGRIASRLKEKEPTIRDADDGDDDSKAIIYSGATIRQLGIMFHSDPKVVARKVSGLVPCGRRKGSAIYRIDEAASRLVKPGYEIERYIMEMNHLDLPPLLSKEFWNSQRARLAFEEANGDLWRTADVVRAISEVFLTVRMALLKMQDAVERQTSLTDVQRNAIRGLVDGALLEARTNLQARFKSYAPSTPDDERGVRLLDNARAGTDRDDTFDVPAQDPDPGRTGVSGDPEDADEYCGL